MEINVTSVAIRYIVDDVDDAISFYTRMLGFKLLAHPAPGFAMLSLGDVKLLLNQPGAGGAGMAMPDGTMPSPGGWNRIHLNVTHLEEAIRLLKEKDASFRNELVKGIGGSQILLQDPSGNLVELFEAYNK